MIQEKTILFREKFYEQPVVLVDGITRTGKSMLGPILTSFEGVELERMEIILERIPQLFMMGKISEDAAISLLRIEVQMKLYESMISRNINFRFGDHSSVFSQAKKLEYIKRAFRKEGDEVVERIKKEKPLFQVQQHDVLGISEIYFKSFGKSLRIIEMIRHPIDVVYSQFKRGYGSREDNDPRIWAFTINFKGHILPWFCQGIEDEYISCEKAIDKVILSYNERSRRLWKTYDNLNHEDRSNVLIVPFEKFVTSPLPYIKKIENFIGRKCSKSIEKTLKKANCPRILKEEEMVSKLEEIKNIASEKYLKMLNQLCEDYNLRITDF